MLEPAINELEHTRDILQNNYDIGDANEAQQALRLEKIASINEALTILNKP